MTGFPYRASAGLDPELVKYLENVGRAASAVSDLDSSATTTQIVTAFNSLLSALRTAGKLEQ